MRSPLRKWVAVKSTAAAVVLAVALFGGANSSSSLSAQTITVRLLNAKTGKPMANKMVTFQWRGSWDESVIALDKNGLGTVAVPPGEHEFTILAGPKVGKEPYRIPYLDCNETKMELLVRVSLVLEKGYVLGNTCGRKTALAQPGEVVFWALPNPWWMPDMQ